MNILIIKETKPEEVYYALIRESNKTEPEPITLKLHYAKEYQFKTLKIKQ